MIIFNLEAATTLLEFFGGDDGEVGVEWLDNGPSGPGTYAHFTDYPEEGFLLLSPELSCLGDPD